MASIFNFPTSSRVTVCGHEIPHATHIRAFFDASKQEVVMGDRLYENPYDVPPESFLQTLLRRGSGPLTREAVVA